MFRTMSMELSPRQALNKAERLTERGYRQVPVMENELMEPMTYCISQNVPTFRNEISDLVTWCRPQN